MQLTRRCFVALALSTMLIGCSSGSESNAKQPTADSSEWHAVQIDGLSFEVPTDAKLNDKSDDITGYWVSGKDVIVNVMVEDGADGVTGEYDAREINGITVYVSSDSETVKVEGNNKTYTLMIMATKDADGDTYATVRDHIIESLSL